LLFGLTGPPRLIPTVWQGGKQVHHNMLYMYCVYINMYLDLINSQRNNSLMKEYFFTSLV
jgi:hypothetical protein